ncbi:sporulation integral membrane protein YlbJ [Bacillaceae bacterium S4-13-58]
MKSHIKVYTSSFLILSLAVCLIIYPDQSLEASLRGLDMWWEIVFPSLLPFFITAELLIGFGVVKFIGILFEPLMRPVFRVSGVGGFVWAMGMASGYPSGAKITARLRQEEQISRIEAERLVSFTNASNPLFIFGAVSVGFFHDPKLGLLLAVSHYGANAFVGFFMRFYGRKEENNDQNNKSSHFSLKRALLAMYDTQKEEKRGFGKILGDAVLSSVHTLLMIGGFIIMFSVFNKLLFLVNITPFIAEMLNVLMDLIGLPHDLSIPFISGIFEITLGSQMISLAQNVSILEQIIVVSFILGFNGLSVQAQVASILGETDIRFKPYFIGRLIHGFFASVLSVLLFVPLYVNRQAISSDEIAVQMSFGDRSIDWLHLISSWGPFITLIALTLAIFIQLKRWIS